MLIHHRPRTYRMFRPSLFTWRVALLTTLVTFFRITSVAAATPSVALAVTAPEGPLLPGEFHLYRVVVTNRDPVTPTGELTVEVNVPQNVAVNTPNQQGKCSPAVCYGSYWAHYGGLVRWTVASIPGGGTQVFQFRGQIENSTTYPPPAAGAVIPVDAVVKSGAVKIAEATTSFGAQHTARTFELAVVGPTEAKPGQVVTYELRYSNVGASTAGGQLSLPVPSGVEVVAASKGAKLSGPSLTWALESSGPGASQAHTVQLRVGEKFTQFTPFKVQPRITTEVQQAPSSAEMVTIVGPVLPVKLSLAVAPSPVAAGGVAVYKLEVTNQSPTASTGDFYAWLTAPHRTVLNQPQAGGKCYPNDCYGSYTAGHSNYVAWPVKSLAPGAVVELQVPATVLKPKKSAAPPPLGSLMVTEAATTLNTSQRVRHVSVVGTSANMVAALPAVNLGSQSEPVASAPSQESNSPPPSTAVNMTPPAAPFIEELERQGAAKSKEPARTPAQRNAAVAWSRYCVAKWTKKQWDERCQRRWQRRADWNAQKAWWSRHRAKK